MSSAAAARVRAVIEPVITAAGYDLEDVTVRQAGGRRLVQVVVDRDGGITLDDVAKASTACSEVLDATEAVEGAYVLEVTSPGTDRPLTLPRHWRRNVGRLVDVRLREGAPLRGRLLAAEDDAATLDVDGTKHAVPYADVARALVQVEFDRPGRRDDEEAR